MARADWLRDELKGRGLRICIPARRGRRCPASHNKRLYNKRHRIENAFARLKDWRGITTRYTRRGDLLPSAIAWQQPSCSGRQSESRA